MNLQWEMIHNDLWVYLSDAFTVCLQFSLCVYCFHYVFKAFHFGLYAFPIMSFTLTMWLCE